MPEPDVTFEHEPATARPDLAPPEPTLGLLHRLVLRAVIGGAAATGRLRARLSRTLGLVRRAEVRGYRGYGSPHRIRFHGRIVEHAAPSPSREGATRWTQLRAMWRRMRASPIPDATIRVHTEGGECRLDADHRGYVDVVLPIDPPITAAGGWHRVGIEVLGPVAGGGEADILVPPGTARLAVISDLDDTVVWTHATRSLSMMREMFTGDARTRLPIAGVSELYRALRDGVSGSDGNPLVYLSRGPWQLEELLQEFFELHDIPSGPALLRDWGPSVEGIDPRYKHSHKRRALEAILETWPDLPVLLIGDSGQEDPEVFGQAVVNHPARIAAVWIRSVDRSPERLQALEALGRHVRDAGAELVLAEDSLAMARHAVRQGWIPEERLEAIERAVADAPS
jgi:phosphatidate phosphatase APP1